MFLKFVQNLQEHICDQVPLVMKLQAEIFIQIHTKTHVPELQAENMLQKYKKQKTKKLSRSLIFNKVVC